MPRYKMVVLSRPTEGRDAEYNDWYQHTHLGQIVALKGFISAQRFQRVRTLSEHTDPYLAIYEIETNDLDSVLSELEENALSGALTMSQALATAFVYAAVYEEFGALITCEKN
jgi:hypothetical protein